MHLAQFGGSELVTVELAEHYASLGHDVTLYSPLIMPPLLPTINRQGITLTTEVPDDLTSYDLVWCHHGLLIDEINRKNKRKNQVIVSNHMSSYVQLERPQYLPDAVDFVFCNSEETRDAIHRITTDYNADLFQNPAPSAGSAFGLLRDKPLGLSISNHRPTELVSFMIKHQTEIDFELFGMKTPNYNRITPDFIRATGCDFVIANGKSVQSAMIAGVPVFLYDHFGGCGWLTEQNFSTAEYYNFSGRGFNAPCDLKTILDFDNQEPIKLGDNRWKFQLDLWLEKKGLI